MGAGRTSRPCLGKTAKKGAWRYLFQRLEEQLLEKQRLEVLLLEEQRLEVLLLEEQRLEVLLLEEQRLVVLLLEEQLLEQQWLEKRLLGCAKNSGLRNRSSEAQATVVWGLRSPKCLLQK